MGCLKTRTKSYHHQRDGLIELVNMMVLMMLAMFVNSTKTNWDDMLPYLALAYNTMVHTSTGFMPYTLTFGEECNL